MKIRTTIVWVLLLGVLSAQAIGSTPPQTSTNQQAGEADTAPTSSDADSAGPSKIDPAKEAAIRRLLDLGGGAAAINQSIDGMRQNMKSTIADLLPPGDYREKLIDLFFEKFRSQADTQQLLEQATQIYAKYLSIEEIEGLIQFYSTPLGRKTLTVLPKVTVEMQSESMKWGENLGRQAMSEVLSEHPELAKALEDAQKRARPQ
jgi:hypothetical protein